MSLLEHIGARLFLAIAVCTAAAPGAPAPEQPKPAAKPRLRLRASRLRVASGERVRIVATLPGASGSWDPTWRSDFGTIDAKGEFLAPPVAKSTYARVWACLQQNSECSSTVLQVVPMRLDPDPLILARGETTQLKAVRDGVEIAVDWKALTGNVTVTPSGNLTVGTGPFDGGLALVLASYNGMKQTLEISIQAAGTVAHASEFHDWLGSQTMALGTFARYVAVKGNWVYAASRSLQYPGMAGPWLSTWLDVYQLDDKKNPVWVDAMESPINCVGLHVVGNDLYVAGADSPNVLLRYDISDGRPVFRDRRSLDGDASTFRADGFGLVIPYQQDPSAFQELQIRDFSTGSTRTLVSDYLPIPGSPAEAAVVGNGWAAAIFSYELSYETVVFDITGPNAVTLAILPSGRWDCSITALQDLLVVDREVYRVSGGEVKLVHQIPGGRVLDADPATKRILVTSDYLAQNDGYHVVDLSDIENPRTAAATIHPDQSTSGRLGPDYFVLLGGGQNISVYPILWQRGIRKVDSFPASPWMNDLRARDGYLFWTGPGWDFLGRSYSFGIFEVNDISSGSATLVASMDRPGDQVGWAIELHGHHAYVGTDAELIVYDVTVPANPFQALVIPAPAYSLELSGNYLYVGSNNGSHKSLLVYDISDPGVPRLVSSISLPTFAYGIAAGRGWLAVALGETGLAIYSLANPATPTPVAMLEGTHWDVAADGNLLHAAADVLGLFIYDLSAPQNPLWVSRTRLDTGTELHGSGFPAALAVSLDQRGIAWVCSSREGRVHGIDVRTPAYPRHVAAVVTGGDVISYSASASLVWNDRLIVAGNDAAFDVAVPQNVGLFGARQANPGEILPNRFGDLLPQSTGVPSGSSEPLKSRVLNGREPGINSNRRNNPAELSATPGRSGANAPVQSARVS